MVTQREWAQLTERMDRFERRQDVHEAENDAKNDAQDRAIHAVEVAQAKSSAWSAFAPWIGAIVLGLAGLGAALLK